MRYARPFKTIIACLLALVLLGAEALAQEKEFSAVTLGTGSPAPVMDRFGPAVLVTAGDQKLLFDAGGEYVCIAASALMRRAG
jgi:ribonuclease Z